jgi:hypothetical protein
VVGKLIKGLRHDAAIPLIDRHPGAGRDDRAAGMTAAAG